MLPEIGNLVSHLFYGDRLLTQASVVTVWTAVESRPMVWLDIQGEEQGDRSFVNRQEVEAAVAVCAIIREKAAPEATITLLSFYNGQLTALRNAMPSELKVAVMTVDACQGSEYDYVVLSTVRANMNRQIRFLTDKQRICVAISRARVEIIFVGSRHCLSHDADWHTIQKECWAAIRDEIIPKTALPEPGTFLSVQEVQWQQRL